MEMSRGRFDFLLSKLAERVFRWETETGIWLLQPPHPIFRLSSLSIVNLCTQNALVLHWSSHPRCTAVRWPEVQSTEKIERSAQKVSTILSVKCHTDDTDDDVPAEKWSAFSEIQQAPMRVKSGDPDDCYVRRRVTACLGLWPLM